MRRPAALAVLLVALLIALGACEVGGDEEADPVASPTQIGSADEDDDGEPEDDEAKDDEEQAPLRGVADLVADVAPSVVAVLVTGGELPGAPLEELPEPEGSPDPGDQQDEGALPDPEDGLPDPDELPGPEDPRGPGPGPGEGQGSGVIVDADGTIVTNAHVVAMGGDVQVAFADGSRADAEVVAVDERTDIAVLSVDVDRDLPAASFSESLPRAGDLAVAIGSPLGFENSVTAGVVSGVNRSLPGAAAMGVPALVDLIQTDAALSPGSSGGALVGEDGLILGISVAFVPPQLQAVSIGFAIPAGTVEHVVAQLLEEGQVSHAFLGVQPGPVTPQVAERFDLETDRGVLVMAVVEGSPADRAGLEPGDVIVAIDDELLDRPEDLLGELRHHDPDDTVTVRVQRDGEEIDHDVTLEERTD